MDRSFVSVSEETGPLWSLMVFIGGPGSGLGCSGHGRPKLGLGTWGFGAFGAEACLVSIELRRRAVQRPSSRLILGGVREGSP